MQSGVNNGVVQVIGTLPGALDASGKFTPSIAQPVADIAVHPGEDTTFDRTFGGGKYNYAAKATTTGQIKSTTAVYAGVIVTTTVTGADILIRDGVSTAGAIVDRIVVGTAAGTVRAVPPVTLGSGLFYDANSATAAGVNVIYL